MFNVKPKHFLFVSFYNTAVFDVTNLFSLLVSNALGVLNKLFVRINDLLRNTILCVLIWKLSSTLITSYNSPFLKLSSPSFES